LPDRVVGGSVRTKAIRVKAIRNHRDQPFVITVTYMPLTSRFGDADNPVGKMVRQAYARLRRQPGVPGGLRRRERLAV
jgi:hypothetical protein